MRRDAADGRRGALAGTRHQALALIAAAAILPGCASTFPLMPAPAVYVPPVAKPLFTAVHPAQRTASIDLLYVTDRTPRAKPEDKLPYGPDRSRSMAFGSATVEIGEQLSWDALVRASTESPRSASLDLKLGEVKELGRFPPIPYLLDVVPGGVTRAPAMVDVHEKAAAGLQAEVTRRLGTAARKEVVLFVHGYANTFQDAAFTMGELCHFLGREFVCAIFTWPAGGSRGLFFGYNVDRESGDFAVQHLKTALRLIAQTPGVERLHLLAHSRGTDVLATALRELQIESYTGGATLGARYKVGNIVLMAPDIDADVAAAKIFGVASDPDLAFGAAANPRGVFPPPGLKITSYVSRGDKALSLSEFLFGSVLRMGRVDESMLTMEQLQGLARFSYLMDIVQVSETSGLIGHSYYTAEPAVSADIVALIRYGLRPGEPGRPLEEIKRPFWRVPRPAAAAR